VIRSSDISVFPSFVEMGKKYIVFNVVVVSVAVVAAAVVGKIFIPYTTVSSNTSICYIYDVTYHINLLLLYNLEHSLIK
jgi:restriction endonuclease S subunit